MIAGLAILAALILIVALLARNMMPHQGASRPSDVGDMTTTSVDYGSHHHSDHSSGFDGGHGGGH